MARSPNAVSVRIQAGSATMDGDLAIPSGARGLVIFAHGSGSGRFSPRNRFVAQYLNQNGIATLLLDLLTTEEADADSRTGQFRFDIDLLTDRLVAATDWARTDSSTAGLMIGYFGASTGAAAALNASARRTDIVAAVVSRGGRPDLSSSNLALVHAPTLLIVGGEDHAVLPLNEWALDRLASSVKELTIVPGATHLFEEPGALEEVSRLARDWFEVHLSWSAHEACRV